MGIVTGELPKEKLVATGSYTPEQLDEVWQTIRSEFAGLIQTDRSNSVFELHRRILYLEWKLLVTNKTLIFLKRQYDLELASVLVELGYDFVDEEDGRGNLRQIYMVESEVKTLLVILNQHINEYKSMVPEDEGIREPSMMELEKELQILSRFQHQRIDKEQITLFEYAAIVNVYLEANKKKD